MDISKILFPLLTGQNPSYEEALYWLQFYCTLNKKGGYVSTKQIPLLLVAG